MRYPGIAPQRTRDVNRVFWLHKLGWAYHNTDQHAKAAEHYRLAAEGIKNNPAIGTELRFANGANLGRMLMKLDQYEQAHDVLEPCLSQMKIKLPWGHQYTVNVIGWLARIYEALEEHEQAQQFYADALAINIKRFHRTGNAATLNRLAWDLLTHRYEQLRDAERALPLAKMACQQARDRQSGKLWLYLDTLALAQHENGDAEAAVDSQREAIERMPDSTPREQQDEMHERLNEFKQALEAEDTQSPIR